MSCPALWMVAECEKPAMKTRATPVTKAIRATLRLSDLCSAVDNCVEWDCAFTKPLLDHPSGVCMSPAMSTVGLLALGSVCWAAFPVSQWHFDQTLADYSCGGSCGVAQTGLPHSHFILLRGTVPNLIEVAGAGRQLKSRAIPRV